MALKAIGKTRFSGGTALTSSEAGGLDGILKKLVTRREVFIAPAAGAVAVHAQFAATIATSAGITSPVHPRNISVTFGANWNATNGGDVLVTGICADGVSRTETIVAAAGTTVAGTYAFATITYLACSVAVTPGAGVTCDIQTASSSTTVFGVCARNINSFVKLAANGANEAIAASSLTLGTFRPTTEPNGAKHFEIIYTCEEVADREANEP